MMTYLYCLQAPDAPPPVGLVGIDGASVRAIDAGGFVAWVSDAPDRVEPNVGRLEAHDGVCASALAGGYTPLPIRFGQTFADDDAAVSAIESREPALRARFDRIAGCVEMRLVFVRGRSDVAPAADSLEQDTPESLDGVLGPGTAFLMRIARAGRDDLAREVTCEDVRHLLRTRLRSLIVDQCPCESSRGITFFPVMVRRASVDAFRDDVTELLLSQASAETPGWSLLGPFAPYSFARDA